METIVAHSRAYRRVILDLVIYINVYIINQNPLRFLRVIA